MTVEIGGITWNEPALSLSFHDWPPPEVVRIHPVRGPLEGGTVVTVFGTGFSASDECVFNTSNGVYEWPLSTFWNSTTVQCAAPPLNVSLSGHGVGSVNDEIAGVWIRETLSGHGLRSGLVARYWYHPTPSFVSITPDFIQDVDVELQPLSTVTFVVEGMRFVDYEVCRVI